MKKIFVFCGKIIAILILLNGVLRFTNPQLEAYIPIKIGGGIGISMRPTCGNFGLAIAKGSYYEKEIKRNQLVTYFRINEDGETKVAKKRVIGLPGETIQIIDGIPYIDNIPLNEPYVLEENNVLNRNLPPITLGENEYYLLGDNRDHSWDSRFIGAVKENQIIAVDIFHINLLK